MIYSPIPAVLRGESRVVHSPVRGVRRYHPLVETLVRNVRAVECAVRSCLAGSVDSSGADPSGVILEKSGQGRRWVGQDVGQRFEVLGGHLGKIRLGVPGSEFAKRPGVRERGWQNGRIACLAEPEREPEKGGEDAGESRSPPAGSLLPVCPGEGGRG